MIKMMSRAGVFLTALVLLIARGSAAGDWSPWDDSETPEPGPSPSLSRETNPARLLGMLAIRGYQSAIRPGLPGNCVFRPSCSRYAFGAIRRHGLLNGSIMGAERVTRCNGFAVFGDYPPLPGSLLHDPPEDKPAPAPWLSFLGF